MADRQRRRKHGAFERADGRTDVRGEGRTTEGGREETNGAHTYDVECSTDCIAAGNQGEVA